MSEVKFYRCNHCGNIIQMIEDHQVVPVCCGEPMELLVANTSDGATEKHVPYVKMEDGVLHVQIGSVEHPMLPEHHIDWIYVQTSKGGQMKYLKVSEPPVAAFKLHDEEVVAVYEYCNLHGLWKLDM